MHLDDAHLHQRDEAGNVVNAERIGGTVNVLHTHGADRRRKALAQMLLKETALSEAGGTADYAQRASGNLRKHAVGGRLVPRREPALRESGNGVDHPIRVGYEDIPDPGPARRPRLGPRLLDWPLFDDLLLDHERGRLVLAQALEDRVPEPTRGAPPTEADFGDEDRLDPVNPARLDARRRVRDTRRVRDRRPCPAEALEARAQRPERALVEAGPDAARVGERRVSAFARGKEERPEGRTAAARVGPAHDDKFLPVKAFELPPAVAAA